MEANNDYVQEFIEIDNSVFFLLLYFDFINDNKGKSSNH